MTNTELIFPVIAVRQLRNKLLQEDELERFAIGYCGESKETPRYLAAEIYPVEDSDLAQQGRGKCRADPEVETEHVNRCVDEGKHPLFIHSHPFQDENVGFSMLDVNMMERATNWLKPHFPETEVLFAVLGKRSVVAARYDTDAKTVEKIPVSVNGKWTLGEPLHCSEAKNVETGPELDEPKYDRNIRVLTENGQRSLNSTRVAVIGVGGLGSIIAEQLVRLGIEDLVLVDPDVVEKSNLPRLQGATPDDVDRSKVEVVQQHLKAINPAIRVETAQAQAQQSEGLLQRCDVLIGGLDRVNARMRINEFAVMHLIPFIDAGVIIERDEETVTAMKGCVQTIVPGATACFSCLNRGDQEQARIERLDEKELEAEIERGYVEDSVLTPEPAVIHLNGLVASKAVDVLVKIVTGIDEPATSIEYESFDNELSPLYLPPAPQCTVCGGDMIGRGDSLPDFPEIGISEEDRTEED